MSALIIDFVAGPCVGKTTIAALTFGELKMKGQNVEWAPEVAKELVWAKKFDLLDNQHEVSRQQYESFRTKASQVDYIVTDGSLLLGLHYNKANTNNICQIDRTERDILGWYRQFRHLVIYLERDPNAPYEDVGRVHNKSEALDADRSFLTILEQNGIEHYKMPSNRDTVKRVVELAMLHKPKGLYERDTNKIEKDLREMGDRKENLKRYL